MDELHIIKNFCRTNIDKLYLYTTEYYDVIGAEIPFQIDHIHDIFFCIISQDYKICIHNDHQNSAKKRSVHAYDTLHKNFIKFRVFCKNLFELTFDKHRNFLLQFVVPENKYKNHFLTDDDALTIHAYKYITKINNIHLCDHCNKSISNKGIKYKCMHDNYHYLHIACKRLKDDEYFLYTPNKCNCNKVASIIQRQFKKSISIPDYVLCKKRLLREFSELVE